MSIWMDLLGTPFSVTTVDAGGIPTRALQAGRGRDVLFLHGTSGHLEAFTRNIGAYVSSGFRCHAIDMLGHGFTGGIDQQYEIPQYVEHAVAYLQAVGAGTQPAAIVGESLGGWVAARLAAEHPALVDRLVLVAPGGTKANPAVMQRIKQSTLEAVLSDDKEHTRQRVELLMFDPKDATSELVDVRFAIYQRPEFRSRISQLLCLQEMEVRKRNLLVADQLKRIQAPTLIVWGRQNPFGDSSEADALHASIPGSELLWIDNCGHWPQHEHAELFNSASISFIRRAGQAPGYSASTARSPHRTLTCTLGIPRANSR